ncbi:hypothetical protein [Streptomyces sp. JJ36]|uniref:hypothetical protein n=1 Tax=Streptomyces sp. JJ36 TaxID=2736645 RepID=UPI001F334A50|nr:hypothetical protein [Streptomyces sp. JJ36]MCF6526496.1 hypothetical protein [Streptomyces sp. JJ36]
MNEHTTRRRFLLAAGSVTAAAALPLATARPAHAEETRDMLSPSDPDAIIPEVSDYWYAQGVSREPLNGWVECTGGEQ